VVSTGAQKQPGLGNLNPALYSLAQSASNAFHDITTGDNIVPCVPNSTQDCPKGTMGYKAGPGYDMVTGLGSVDAYNVAVAMGGPSPAKPSLVLTDFTADNSVSAGGAFTSSFTVANKGDADAGAFVTFINFTTNGDVSTALKVGVGCNVKNGLAAGKTLTCSGTVKLDPSIITGTYYLLAEADANGQNQPTNHPGIMALASTGPLTVN
jgi:hypothetical protein